VNHLKPFGIEDHNTSIKFKQLNLFSSSGINEKHEIFNPTKTTKQSGKSRQSFKLNFRVTICEMDLKVVGGYKCQTIVRTIRALLYGLSNEMELQRFSTNKS
jgi:hypothetical protein